MHRALAMEQGKEPSSLGPAFAATFVLSITISGMKPHGEGQGMFAVGRSLPEAAVVSPCVNAMCVHTSHTQTRELECASLISKCWWGKSLNSSLGEAH